MAQLTKEYFDERIGNLATKQDLRHGIDDLARMVKNGFDSADKNFAKLTEMLQVRKDVEELKVQMLEMRQALNLKH